MRWTLHLPRRSRASQVAWRRCDWPGRRPAGGGGAGQAQPALSASALLHVLLGPAADLGATMPAGAAAQSLVLEFVLTFFLMFVISAVATDARAAGQMAGLAIGGTVALAALLLPMVSL